jgi:hypothetical protein
MPETEQRWLSYKVIADGVTPEWTEVPGAVGYARRDGGNEGDIIDFLGFGNEVLLRMRLPIDARMELDGCRYLDDVGED